MKKGLMQMMKKNQRQREVAQQHQKLNPLIMERTKMKNKKGTALNVERDGSC
jgi:hypothetical protein